MKHKTQKHIYNIIVITLLAAGIVWTGAKFFHFGNVEYTDNAQVKQLIIPVNARIQGYIKEVRFEEYQQVKKGDTLLIIEDAEFRYRVAQAEADYRNALSGSTVIASSVKIAANDISVSDAGLAEIKALLNNAATEYIRYRNLLNQESVTQQEFDAAHTKYLALKAKYETLHRQKQTTVLVKAEHGARLNQNKAAIELAKSALDLAKLNLTYTVLVAPCDGFTGRKALQVGQLLQPGQAVVDIVDNNEKWVIANYKETQTGHFQEGQEVEMEVDALPGKKLKGIIASLSNATGAAFSIIPQDNSAGNFVKVQQRIPVRIEFSKDNDRNLIQRLRAGMNVECKVKY